MEKTFWQEKWQKNEIAFHQDDYHPLLEKHLPSLQLKQGARVFVPLCGKSADLICIRDMGFKVCGLELSEIAVQAFFTENNIEFETREQAGFVYYESPEISIICGDFYSLNADITGKFDAVFDRASLIAMPPDMRAQYAGIMKRVCPEGCKTLLVALEYEPGVVNAPPFVVTKEEIEKLYSDWCQVTELERADSTVKGKACYEIAYKFLRQ